VTAARRFPRVVLFDLDGTLLDSAPDMLATVNALRAARRIAPMHLQDLRPHVSRGARAMLAAAFPGLDADARERLVGPFLDEYRRVLGHFGQPFADIERLLTSLEGDGARWGIVTNKPQGLARALLPLLGWQSRCAVLIGGDTLPLRKPDPLPLRIAAARLNVAPAACVYVGDDQRDIAAARAAAMPSIAALWGYRTAQDDPLAWQADAAVEQPADLLQPGIWPTARR